MTPQDYGLIYLASPYSKYPHGIMRACRDICEIAARLIKQQYRIYSPIAHAHTIADITRGTLNIGIVDRPPETPREKAEDHREEFAP